MKVKEIKNYCLHGVYLLFHNKSDTLHYLFAIPSAFTDHQCRHKDVALTRLARWYDEVDKSGFLTFGRVARSIQTHYLEIINYFERRSTNAASESFNAKIKNFRSQFRGVKDRAFFLFRLSKIYA